MVIGRCVVLTRLMPWAAVMPGADRGGDGVGAVISQPEKAILRRLVEAGSRIVQLGYGGNEGDVGGGEGDQIDAIAMAGG